MTQSNIVLDSTQWFNSLVEQTPKQLSYIDRVLIIDRNACTFTRNELIRRELAGDLDGFLTNDLLKFIQLMEITFCIYLSNDGESGQLARELANTNSEYKEKPLRKALAALHLKIGMLNFRFNPTEVKQDLLLYLDEIRPELRILVKERFNAVTDEALPEGVPF